MLIMFGNTSTRETPDVQEFTKEEVLELMKQDLCLHEFYYRDENARIKVHFDIDRYDRIFTRDQILRKSLDAVNTEFGTTDDSWAICEGTRAEKISFHFVLINYYISLKELNKIILKMHRKEFSFDPGYTSINNPSSYKYNLFRLPNQSKSEKFNGIKSPPLQILQGNLQDFFITL
jgi:hypothetical protein